MFDNQVVQDLKWWEVAAGALSVPVALLGFIYTIFLIRKTDFETKKLKLEVAEKEATLSASPLLRPANFTSSFALSWKEKLFAFISLTMNLAIVLVFGLKRSPLIGLEVLAMVIGTASCLSMVGGFFLLQVLRLIDRLVGILEKFTACPAPSNDSTSKE